jgi:hypothetical protein
LPKAAATIFAACAISSPSRGSRGWRPADTDECAEQQDVAAASVPTGVSSRVVILLSGSVHAGPMPCNSAMLLKSCHSKNRSMLGEPRKLGPVPRFAAVTFPLIGCSGYALSWRRQLSLRVDLQGPVTQWDRPEPDASRTRTSSCRISRAILIVRAHEPQAILLVA